MPPDDPSVRFGHDGRATLVADELLGTLDHAMLLAGLVHAHLAAGGETKALLGAALGLELGH